jgi:hypothetical protein
MHVSYAVQVGFVAQAFDSVQQLLWTQPAQAAVP